MKHYKTLDNKVFAFEADGSQDHLIKPDMVEITTEEIIVLTAKRKTDEELATDIRNKRNSLLVESDWSQLADIPSDIKSKWAVYRQLLRDIPLQEGFPLAVIWPTKPV